MTHLSIHPPSWLPFSLAVAAIVVLIILWLYAPQLVQLSRPWRTLLPGLRLTAVLALAISVLRPSVLRPRTPAEQGAVVILQDVSRSMGVVDVGRASGSLDIAEALGLLRQRSWDAPIEPLRASVEQLRSAQQATEQAHGDLDYARLAGRGIPQAEQRERAAVDRFRAAASDLITKAAGFARAPQLLSRSRELLAQMAEPPDAWLRSSARQVNAITVALEGARNLVAEELLSDDAALRDASRAVAAMSRRQLAERALTAEDIGLLASLDPQTPVFAFHFGTELRPFVPGTIGTDAGSNATSQPSDIPQDPDASTDLTGALRQVNERLRGQDVRAIVLFSDGRQVAPSGNGTTRGRGGKTGGSSNVEAGQTAGISSALKAPILGVQCGRRMLRDRSIAGVSAPASAFAGESIAVHVEARSTIPKDEAVDITLDTPGFERQSKHVDLAGDSAVAEFSLKLSVPGVQRISIGVTSAASEATFENNRVQRLIKVLSGKIRVALVSGSASWEYQYLRNALSRTPFIDLSDANLVSGEGGGAGAQRWPMDADRIGHQDVLIFCDVAAGAVSEEQWSAVRRAAADRGASAIFLVGQENTGSASVAKGAAAGALGELLPWLPGAQASRPPLWQVWPGAEPGYRVVPGPEGDQVDSLRLAENASDNRRRWADLPALFRYLKFPEIKPGVRRLLVEHTSGDPVLTEQRVGVGRSFFLATDETWRWRLRTGERDHDRFWLQLMRYAAEQPYAAQEHGLALDVDPVSAEPGQIVRIRARLLDGHEQPIPQRQAPPTIDIVRADQTVLCSLPLEPAAGAAGRYQAQWEAAEAGVYSVKLRLSAFEAQHDRGTPSVAINVAANGEAEMSDLSPDDENLARIASASGGELLNLRDLRSLPERISAARAARRPIEYRLWDSPYLFLLVLGCLGAEWAVRKRVGLV